MNLFYVAKIANIAVIAKKITIHSTTHPVRTLKNSHKPKI